MASIRGLIIALIILAAGIFAIQRIGDSFLKQPGLPIEIGAFGDLIVGVRGLTNTIIMGIGALVVLLIFVWIGKKIKQRREVRATALTFPRRELPQIPEKPIVQSEEYHEVPEKHFEEEPEEEKKTSEGSE